MLVPVLAALLIQFPASAHGKAENDSLMLGPPPLTRETQEIQESQLQAGPTSALVAVFRE